MSKESRIQAVFLAMCELYLKLSRPIASQTLKDECFPELSSATLRNYFVELEEEGYLAQIHASAGRVPTEKAFRLYAQEHAKASELSEEDELFVRSFFARETREIVPFLSEVTEALAALVGSPVVLSAPRFDKDHLSRIALVEIDSRRYLAILVTEFGAVKSEVIFSPRRFSSFALKRMEEFCSACLSGEPLPEMDGEEKSFALAIYQEIALRYLVGYAHFSTAEIYRAGFSKLLSIQEFRDPLILAETLALFEGGSPLLKLLQETLEKGELSLWMGDELMRLLGCKVPAAVISIPYFIGEKKVGALAVLGPEGQNYPRLFAILRRAATLLGQSLTRSAERFEISFREPSQNSSLEEKPQLLIGQTETLFKTENL